MSDIIDGYYKIYDYTPNQEPSNFNKPPFDLNYDILGLYKERKFNKGELYEVNYYGEYDVTGQTYSDLVVKEQRTYYRINELIHRREMNIIWYYDSGLSGSTKQTTKYYTIEESLEAGVRRRRQVVSFLKIATLGLITTTSGVTIIEAEAIAKPFLTDNQLVINLYIEGDEEPFKNLLATSTDYSWLDNVIDDDGTKIRDYLYSEVNIDYTINNTNI